MNENTLKKLKILAESAKYDVSCSSSGTTRANTSGGVGNAAGWGICHSFSEDGRCISLLKILHTNYCIYDCAYCINRRGNDIPRAAFSVNEVVDVTMEFYRRNYIEGLFLSSGVIKNPDYTMERLVRVVKNLRTVHRFNGYIHLKAIPGASQELIHTAGLYADRLSVNIEIPSESNLKRLAPEKDHTSVYLPMNHIHNGMVQNKEERKKFRSAPKFAPAGQSTQMIIGASNERDCDILQLSSFLYSGPSLKRVYYSGFVPVNGYDTRLPMVQQTPLVRENRLYQADWLMRFYQFSAAEIVDESCPNLDLEIDPKLAWALRHPEYFPVNINTAEYAQILRIPGIGVTSAQRIVAARRYGKLTADNLKKMGVVLKRAQYFIDCPQAPRVTINELGPKQLRKTLTAKKNVSKGPRQLSLFDDIPAQSAATATVSQPAILAATLPAAKAGSGVAVLAPDAPDAPDALKASVGGALVVRQPTALGAPSSAASVAMASALPVAAFTAAGHNVPFLTASVASAAVALVGYEQHTQV